MYPAIVFAHAGLSIPSMPLYNDEGTYPHDAALWSLPRKMRSSLDEWMEQELKPKDGSNYFLLDRNGEVIQDGMKHKPRGTASDLDQDDGTIARGSKPCYIEIRNDHLLVYMLS
jgi:hypothetical protein